MAGRIRTLIADDEGVIREGLRAFLELDHQIEIVGEAINGRQVIQMVAHHQPDIVILDIDLHDLTGTEVIRHIHATTPAIRIVCLVHSAQPEPGDLPLANPYHTEVVFSKNTTSRQLLDCIHGVMESEALLSQHPLAWPSGNAQQANDCMDDEQEKNSETEEQCAIY